MDVTKTWPEDLFPLQPVGRMVLNRWGGRGGPGGCGCVCCSAAALTRLGGMQTQGGLLRGSVRQGVGPARYSQPPTCSVRTPFLPAATPTISSTRTSSWPSAPPWWCPVRAAAAAWVQLLLPLRALGCRPCRLCHKPAAVLVDVFLVFVRLAEHRARPTRSPAARPLRTRTRNAAAATAAGLRQRRAACVQAVAPVAPLLEPL